MKKDINLVTRFIFPYKVMSWETLKSDSGGRVTASEDMNAIGYIPVYDSIPAMVKDHGNKILSGTFEAEKPK